MGKGDIERLLNHNMAEALKARTKIECIPTKGETKEKIRKGKDYEEARKGLA